MKTEFELDCQNVQSLMDELLKWFNDNRYDKETVNGFKAELHTPFEDCGSDCHPTKEGAIEELKANFIAKLEKNADLLQFVLDDNMCWNGSYEFEQS
jgi:hypothetical protein